MNDYARIARAIEYLDRHRGEQPDLAALSRHVGLSPSHFHRLFSNWAGITPKDFLQCLTVEHARESLREGKSVLDAALASGLSGPGRLHDLCVTLHAASPGEIKSGGEGWIISLGLADSPFGSCLIAESPRGICHLSFLESADYAAAERVVRGEWPHAELQRNDARARKMAALIFSTPGDRRRKANVRALVRGTLFQIRVWRALLNLPFGALTSYGEIATALGSPNSSRAAGHAIGSNHIAYLIPCHRVIRNTGVMGGYKWGTIRKKSILAWEYAYSAKMHHL